MLDDSPSAALAARLGDDGIRVIAFDPLVEPGALGESIEFVTSLDECVGRADVVVLGTPDEAFAEIDVSSPSGGSPLPSRYRLLAEP